MEVEEIPKEPRKDVLPFIEEYNDIVPKKFLRLHSPLPVLQLPFDVPVITLVDPFIEATPKAKIPIKLSFYNAHKNKVNIILCKQNTIAKDGRIQCFHIHCANPTD